jgi:hypothetical protein
MKLVTKQEFYAAIGPRDIRGRIVTSWPYTTDFLDYRTQVLVGRSIESRDFEVRADGTCGQVTTYYIDEEALSQIPEIK